MANRFLSNIKINDAYTFPASDGTTGQAIITDGSGNLSFSTISLDTGATVIYQDNFTGDNLTTAFTLANSVNDEVITQVYIDGVYQSKLTYSTSGDQLIFTEAPFTGASIEVISMNTVSYGGFQFDVTGAADNDLLVYNASNGLWESTNIVNSIRFEGGLTTQGTLSWNTEDETLDLTVSPNVTYQLGQELGQTVRNLSGATLLNGAVVKVTGASGNKITVDIADNTAELGSSETFAVVTETINNNSTGKVTTEGLVRGLDTSLLTEGVAIWLGANGAFTQTKPQTPNHLVHIGWVVRSHATEGAILVRISNGWEMEELHDVLITSVADKDMLVWNGTQGYWENTKTLGNITTGTINTGGNRITCGSILVGSGLIGYNIADMITFNRTISVGGDIIITGNNYIDVTQGPNSSYFRYDGANYIAVTTGSTLNAVTSSSNYEFRIGTYGAGDLNLYAGGSQRVSIDNATGDASFTSKGSFASSVAVGDDTDLASASNVGALRYREDVNGSYVDMCMKTSSAPTYAWVNIVSNTF